MGACRVSDHPDAAPQAPATATHHDRHGQYAGAHTVEQFRANLADVRARIDAAARRADRDPAAVRLLPVSKTVPAERVRLAHLAGCRDFGENKVQEALTKSQQLADLAEVRWAVIGHLQTNKAKYVARFAHEFQALDSPRVAEALERRLQAEGRGLDVYIQVNTSGEASKYGLEPDHVAPFLAHMPQFSALRVRGLMTLAAFTHDGERVRSCFVRLRELRDRLLQDAPDGVAPEGLSMGMSGDFEIGVEEGATVVRVGQAIFGARDTPDAHYWPGGAPG